MNMSTEQDILSDYTQQPIFQAASIPSTAHGKPSPNRSEPNGALDAQTAQTGAHVLTALPKMPGHQDVETNQGKLLLARCMRSREV